MLIKHIDNSANILDVLVHVGEARLQFSQLGEDAVLWHYFAQKRGGFYVDVGCHHPYRYSNTALLSIFNGWRGLNIDLDERAIAAFNEVRPQDTNVQCAIGPIESAIEVTVFEDGAVNSLDPAMSDHQATLRPVIGKKTVQVRPLATILDEYLPPNTIINFMNVDAEGWDHIVLQSNNWLKYRPEMIAVELHGFDLNNPAANATFQFLQNQGYSLVSHLVVTSIFQRVRA